MPACCMVWAADQTEVLAWMLTGLGVITWARVMSAIRALRDSSTVRS